MRYVPTSPWRWPPLGEPIRYSSWAPLRAAVQATFEFFEADKATVKLLLRDAYALGDRFEKHLGGIYERFIDDIETIIVVAQERGKVVSRPAPDGGLHAGGAGRAVGAPAAEHRRRRHRSRGRRFRRCPGA